MTATDPKAVVEKLTAIRESLKHGLVWHDHWSRTSRGAWDQMIEQAPADIQFLLDQLATLTRERDEAREALASTAANSTSKEAKP